jgi:hypothetical protein
MAAVTWAFRVSVCTIPSIIFLFFFYRFSRRITPSESARRIALLAFALGSPALPYALLFMSHQPAAVSVGGAFILAVKLVRDTPQRAFLTAVGVGFLAAMGVMMDYQTVIASTLIGLYVLIRDPRRLPSTAGMVLGAAPIVIVLAAYHKICFGGALTTGCTYAADTVTRRGFLGMVGPSWESFHALVLDPANGILVLAPWCILGLVGFVAIMAHAESRGRFGAEALVCLGIVVGLVFMLVSLYPTFARAGWCVGPRYMTAALPFLGWLAAAGFEAVESHRLLRTFCRGLVVTAVVIFVVGATTYPHWPDALKNPLFELSFRLLRDNYAVRSIGTSFGLRGFVSILPVYLLAAALTWHLLGAGRKDAPALRLLSCVLGMALIAGYSFFPRSGPYADRAYGFVTGTWEPKRR